MRFAVCAIILTALGACAPAQQAQEEAPVANSNSVPAPTPRDVAVRITAEQNGQMVRVGVNQRFAIELVGVPTAGYVWAPSEVPAFITRAGEASGNTTTAQSQPGFAGGNHWEVTMFAATAAGTGDIVMVQRRPWESDEPPSATFRVTIVAE
jgi:predicted secreted protein